MKSVNVINVNGKEFFLDDRNSFLDMMEYIGLTKDDVKEYAYTDFDKECIEFAIDNKNRDCICGDDYYNLCWEMDNYLKDFRAAIECLRKPSRKGNTRQDIANYLDVVCSNYQTIIP